MTRMLQLIPSRDIFLSLIPEMDMFDGFFNDPALPGFREQDIPMPPVIPLETLRA